MGNKDFFKILRTKTHQEPNKGFDQEFWGKFNEEFQTLKPRRHERWFPSLRFAMPIGAAALLLLVVYSGWERVNENTQLVDQQEVQGLLAIQPVIQDMDLFIGEEWLEEPVDFTALSEEEWEILLEEKG